MATLIRSDLEFILKQIVIAETHAAGGDLAALVGDPLLSFGLRTVDGSFNNLIPGQENFGAADQLFPRVTTPVFRTAEDNPFTPGVTPTTYAQTSGLVFDSQPRTISNLIVDATVNNPSAVAVAAGTDGAVQFDHDDNPDTPDLFFIPNRAPDEGLSAPFNSWFTFFGQFFDHGLDLTNKGGSGTVIVPLQPDDPLYNPASPQTNFMVLTRATNQPGIDGVLGTADDVHEHINQTTPLVDQNQTYTSNASHQVFLREYELNAAGKPVATGRMLGGDNGGLATWADVKAQAQAMLGIQLDDQDVLNVPLLLTDQYGKFIPDPGTGFAQIVTAAGPPPVLASGTPGSPVDATLALRTGHAFLDDIAHHANPFGDHDGNPSTSRQALTADSNLGTGDDGNPATYDDELLNAHFITGDGRGNENIALTSVHHVFHSEHNRQVAEIQATITASGDAAFIASWQLPDGSWNGERLFQAARFATEMQYQHLVFEEFARKVQPQVNVFAGIQTDINPAIVAEFAHTVYRFGHSMLTETVDRLDPNFVSSDLALLDAFLNPLAFDNNGAVSADVAAGAIVRGMTRQVGNEIDEFVTEAVRNNLLGLPLDLATINITRGRDTGVPSLNNARRDFYAATGGDSQLKPYDSWFDYALNIKNVTSIVNFIAAYGQHSTILAATTLDGKRAAADLIVFGGADAPADRGDFLNSTGAWATQETGLNLVDFWIGGLAEAKSPFGGLLGSTFNFVFETQMEKLQDGDRLYYLARTAGLNFLTELENNSFASLVMLNTDTTHLPGDIFSTPNYILEANQALQFNAGLGNADPVGDSPIIPLVIRSGSGDNLNLRFTGGEHVVLGGTEGNNTLIAGIGDDTIWGDGGNDKIEGGAGNDILNGGAGDDIITDSFGDDNLKGNDGNDVINGGPGLDLILGGNGQDFVVAGRDPKETFGGGGNDFIFAGDSSDVVFGNEGDDWIEGGDQADLLIGDNGEPFQISPVIGNDVINGGGGNDDYDSESGDDIMLSDNRGTERLEGMLGFDWASYQLATEAVDADMNFTGLLPPDIENLSDRFDLVEGLSGSRFSDILRGDNFTSVDLAAAEPVSGQNNALNNAQQIGLIDGLQALIGAGATSFSGGNIILGGDGGDIIEGRAGDDIIDGDAFLSVRLSVRDANNPNVEILSANSMADIQAAVFAGAINPGQIRIVREILFDATSGDNDKAVFSDVQANYLISSADANGWVTISHVVNGVAGADGVDRVRNIERLQFTDGIVAFDPNDAPTGAPVISDATPTEGQPLTASTSAIADADGLTSPNFTFQWQRSNTAGTVFTNIAGAMAAAYTPVQADVGLLLQVVVTFVDDRGTTEIVSSAPTGVVGDFINDPDDATPNNTLTGTAGDDIINGNSGTDTLNGLAGNDILDGGTGSDTMNGGAGNDTFFVAQTGDAVIEALNGGIDTVNASITHTLAANVENLTLTGAANINGAGNGLANVLTGNAGNNTLNGGLGADTMLGGLGNDIYIVDNAGDIVTELFNQGIDTVQTSLLSYTLGANVENLAIIPGSTGNRNWTGNELANTITSNGGADTLNGLAGNDILNGNGGADTLNGGEGVDTLNGGGGNDRLNTGAGNETVNVSNGNDTIVLAAGFGNDTVISFDATVTFFSPGQDRIDVAAYGFTAADIGTNILIAAAGANTTITIGADVLTLQGVNQANITQTDFLFA